MDEEPKVKPEHDKLLDIMLKFEDVEQVYEDLKKAMATIQASGAMDQVIDVGEHMHYLLDDFCKLRGEFIRYCTKFQNMDWNPKEGLAAPIEKPKS